MSENFKEPPLDDLPHPKEIHPVAKLVDTVFTKPTAFLNKIWKSVQRQNPDNHFYHRRYRRVPGIETCEVDDAACIFEANEQYRRDKRVEKQIWQILKAKRRQCRYYYNFYQQKEHGYCDEIEREYDMAATNYLIKYGDMSSQAHVIEAFTKQKHRMMWERRHGEVGTGMKSEQTMTLFPVETFGDKEHKGHYKKLRDKFINFGGEYGIRIRDGSHVNSGEGGTPK